MSDFKEEPEGVEDVYGQGMTSEEMAQSIMEMLWVMEDQKGELHLANQNEQRDE